MKTIYKYPIQIDREQQILMLEGAEIIRVGLDPRGVPCVWAELEITNAPEKWEIAIVGTGQTLPDGKHMGSFLYGEFVWHVYRMNVKEHATLSAGARIDHGVDVETT